MNNFEEDVMVVVERVEKELTNSMSKLKIDYPDEKDFVLSLFASQYPHCVNSYILMWKIKNPIPIVFNNHKMGRTIIKMASVLDEDRRPSIIDKLRGLQRNFQRLLRHFYV